MKIENEKCLCQTNYPIVLQYYLSDNSIVCSNCNLERNIRLTEQVKTEIVEWNQIYGRIYKIWLRNDKLLDELTNPFSDINVSGLIITRKLNLITPSYYWLHSKEDTILNKCPKCEVSLIPKENNYSEGHKVCENCRILISEY